jgi:hypothetical protein
MKRRYYITKSTKKKRTKQESIEECTNLGMIGPYLGQNIPTDFLCRCGASYKARPAHILNRNTGSCGCHNKKMISKALYKGGKYMSGTEFSTLRGGSRKSKTGRRRDIEFNITINDIEYIYECQDKKCALSGIDLVFNKVEGSGPTREVVPGNASVDRINNKLGYLKENIQLLDKDVNFMKRDLSQDRFLLLCRLITDKQNKGEYVQD